MLSASVLSLGIASGAGLPEGDRKQSVGTLAYVREEVARLDGRVSTLERPFLETLQESRADIQGLRDRLDNVCIHVGVLERNIEKTSKSKEKSSKKQEVVHFNVKISSEELLSHLNSVAIGNEEAKQDIVCEMMLHLERIQKILDSRAKKDTSEELLDLSRRVFVVGESGCGKNLLIEAAAKKVGLPFVLIDASGITAEGYEGTKIEKELSVLKDVSNGEFAIIFLNELDKLSKKAGGPEKGVGGVTAQYQLLTFLDGSKGVGGTSSKNLLVVGAGAFEHIERNGRKILTKDDLLKEGGMSEQFGERFSFIQLESASTESFGKWLRDPKHPFQSSIKALKEDRSVDFVMDEALLDQLALRLSQRTSHFRSAKESVVSAFYKIIRPRVLKKSMKEAFKNIETVEVTEESTGRITFHVKSIDFFVTEVKKKTAEEVLMEAMKGKEHQEKVEEEAKSLRAKKEAEKLVEQNDPWEMKWKPRLEGAAFAAAIPVAGAAVLFVGSLLKPLFSSSSQKTN